MYIVYTPFCFALPWKACRFFQQIIAGLSAGRPEEGPPGRARPRA